MSRNAAMPKQTVDAEEMVQALLATVTCDLDEWIIPDDRVVMVATLANIGITDRVGVRVVLRSKRCYEFVVREVKP